MHKKIKGGVLVTIGYLLSPLSWWNDIFINIPLAFGFGFLFGLISKKLFLPMMILGYWITNVLGFIMLHHGLKTMVSKKDDKYARKVLIKDIIISIIYTLIVILLIKIGWLKFPLDYFK